MRCRECGRRNPPCHFVPILMSRGWWDENDRFHFEAADLCKDCDAWLRAGKPPRETPTEELEPMA